MKLTHVLLATSLALTPAFVPAANAAALPHRPTITCPHGQDQRLVFRVPAKSGGLPTIDFDYPSKVTRFSFRDGNLLLVAMDDSDTSRVRVVVSAQLNKTRGTYDGQIVLDYGGHELQLDNTPVSCSVRR